jgi:Spx/MgsR family transcriptional regulator
MSNPTAATPNTLYGIPNCDTVKRARAWLAEQGHSVPFHDFKKQGVPAERLQQWLQAAGWQVLVNRQGSTWRKLTADEQAAVVDAATAHTLLLAQPSIIKRPVVQWADGSVTVGLQAMMDQAGRRS